MAIKTGPWLDFQIITALPYNVFAAFMAEVRRSPGTPQTIEQLTPREIAGATRNATSLTGDSCNTAGIVAYEKYAFSNISVAQASAVRLQMERRKEGSMTLREAIQAIYGERAQSALAGSNPTLHNALSALDDLGDIIDDGDVVDTLIVAAADSIQTPYPSLVGLSMDVAKPLSGDYLDLTYTAAFCLEVIELSHFGGKVRVQNIFSIRDRILNYASKIKERFNLKTSLDELLNISSFPPEAQGHLVDAMELLWQIEEMIKPLSPHLSQSGDLSALKMRKFAFTDQPVKRASNYYLRIRGLYAAIHSHILVLDEGDLSANSPEWNQEIQRIDELLKNGCIPIGTPWEGTRMINFLYPKAFDPSHIRVALAWSGHPSHRELILEAREKGATIASYTREIPFSPQEVIALVSEVKRDFAEQYGVHPRCIEVGVIEMPPDSVVPLRQSPNPELQMLEGIAAVLSQVIPQRTTGEGQQVEGKPAPLIHLSDRRNPKKDGETDS